MKKVRWIALMLTFATAACVSLIGQEQRSRVGQLSVVKFEALNDAVVRNRGKVILIDFWAEFCPPCKANFPHVVRLHRQYAREGLVVISVSGDDIKRANRDDVLKRIRGFLAVNGADFTNFLLDEPQEVFEEKLRIKSIPCYYVFSRKGKWTQFGGGSGLNIDFAVMERLITDLLKDR